MKLFSRITFLCNLCFIAMVILRYIEIYSRKSNVNDRLIPLPFVSGTLVVLGQLAVFINLIFCMAAIGLVITKKIKQTSHWLVYSNIILLVVQLFYFLS